MNVNLVHLVKSTISQRVLDQLSGKFGLSSEIIQRVVAQASAVLVVSLMEKSATLGGAEMVFFAIMSAETNARIAEELADLVTTTTSLKQLELSGYGLAGFGDPPRFAELSDQIAAQGGVPTQAAHALTGLVSAALFGVLKHHFLLSQGKIAQLPLLLGRQLSVIAPYVTDGVAIALGFVDAANFFGCIPGQLGAVAASLDPPGEVKRKSIVEAGSALNPSVRRAMRWRWMLLFSPVAVLAVLFAYIHQSPALGNSEVAHSTGASESRAPLPTTIAASATVPNAALIARTAVTGASNAIAPGATPASNTTASSAAPASQTSVLTPTKGAQLTFFVDSVGTLTLNATLGSDAEREQMLDTLTSKFGAGHFSVIVDPNTKPADWLADLDGLLPLMSLPHAAVELDGEHIELSGGAAEDRFDWRDRLKTLLGPSYIVDAFNVDQAVADATTTFRGAIKDTTGPDGSCSAADITKVLNKQIFNFARSSGHVPASSSENLRRSAQLLMACANSGSTPKLEVAAYTDDIGDPRANLLLSKKRADAVRAFLVDAGVRADSLTAQGYGVANPVASNDTESGRFTNRRIEFIEMPR